MVIATYYEDGTIVFEGYPATIIVPTEAEPGVRAHLAAKGYRKLWHVQYRDASAYAAPWCWWAAYKLGRWPWDVADWLRRRGLIHSVSRESMVTRWRDLRPGRWRFK